MSFFAGFIERYEKIFYLIFNGVNGIFFNGIFSLVRPMYFKEGRWLLLRDFTYSPIKANHSQEWDVRYRNISGPAKMFGGQSCGSILRSIFIVIERRMESRATEKEDIL